MKIGKAIRVLLAENEMQQKDLARKMNVTEAYVSHLMKGEANCSIKIIEKIAAIFDLRASELLVRAER